jgi:hypothetical protein
MSYTKTYTYLDGTVIPALSHEANEEGAKVYVNQGIITADITNNTLDTTDYATPRYTAVGATGDFVTKTIQGNTDLNSITNRAYFTSTAKLNRQKLKNALNFQAIPNAGAEVFVDRANAFFLITVYVKVACLDNTVVAGNGGIGNALLDNLVAIQTEDLVTGSGGYYGETTGWAFEGAGSYSATYSDQDCGDGGNSASQRSMTLQFRGLINGRGRKRFQLVVSPKVERGFITSKSFIVETFYT